MEIDTGSRSSFKVRTACLAADRRVRSLNPDHEAGCFQVIGDSLSTIIESTE